MRSLLELLNKEEEIVKLIEKNDDKYQKLNSERIAIESNPVDCDRKINDLARIDDKLINCNNANDAYQNMLIEARGRIREYFDTVIYPRVTDD